MKKFIFCTATIILLVSTFFTLTTFAQRLRMPFNDEGNYFDPTTMIVYHQQSILSYGVISFLLLLISCSMLFKILSLFRKSSAIKTP